MNVSFLDLVAVLCLTYSDETKSGLPLNADQTTHLSEMVKIYADFAQGNISFHTFNEKLSEEVICDVQ